VFRLNCVRQLFHFCDKISEIINLEEKGFFWVLVSQILAQPAERKREKERKKRERERKEEQEEEEEEEEKKEEEEETKV
jgi:hypothetical protein